MAVVGAVGSGKSSLISSILGEMFRLSGDIRFNVSSCKVPLFYHCNDHLPLEVVKGSQMFFLLRS